MVDAQLYLPKEWFDNAYEKLRQRWHIPKERRFVFEAGLGSVLPLHGGT